LTSQNLKQVVALYKKKKKWMNATAANRNGPPTPVDSTSTCPHLTASATGMDAVN
jgi:hypothetical protein